MKLSYCICLFLIISACQKKSEIEIKTLKPVSSIGQLNDSTFLTDALDKILFTQHFNIIADNKQNCLFYVSDEFELIRKVPYGEGPEEVRFTYQMIENQGQPIVADYGKFSFQTLDEQGLVVKSLKPSTEEWTSFLYGFGIDNNGFLYMSSHESEYPIIKLDTSGNVVNQFGNWLEADNQRHKRTINNRYLTVNSRNQLINIYVSKPMVELWSEEGELVWELDLSEILAFRTRQYDERLRENPELKEILAFTYYNDFYLTDDQLYLLFIGDYEVPNSNQLLHIDTSDGLELKSVINLVQPGAYFKNIAIKGSQVFAYDRAAAEIVTFDLR